MAGVPEVVNNLCPVRLEEDSTRMENIKSDSSDSEQAISPTVQKGSWERMGNGSLPVAVPTQQANPGFHHVESSTTDSGVSNASSVTSDCVAQLAAGDMSSVAATELRLELTTVERVLNSCAIDDSRVPTSMSVSPVSPAGHESNVRESEKIENGSEHSKDNVRLDLSTREGDSVEERESNCSSSLESPDTRPNPCNSETASREVAATSSLASSFSMDTQSLNGVVLASEQRSSPDTLSLNNIMPRRSSSSGLSWGGTRSVRSIFNRTSKNKLSYVGSVDARSQSLIAASSTTGLILQGRPRTLPAKSAAEEKRHQKLYDEMVTAARRKELLKAKEAMQKEKLKHQKDKMAADSLREWQKILPNWENMKNSKRVRELWWLGLPPGIRGQVWKRAISNDLNISPELYQISLSRCREKLASLQSRARADSGGSLKSINREHSVEVIHLDVLRTFPTLGFFQEGGPYNQLLHDVLGAYACYRPDVGYVQGMSFLAAVLLLNMEASDAFIHLANLLNRTSYLAFFRVDHDLMQPYFNTFTALLSEHLPRVYDHFTKLEFSPEYYLIEWIFTMYTRTFPLDVACRVWDLFCRDGDCFLFRTALGVLRLFQTEIMERYTIEEVGQFLGHLPDTIDCDMLFQHIGAVNLTAKKFAQCLQQHTPATS